MIEPGRYIGTLQMVGVSESRNGTPFVYGEYAVTADDEPVMRTVRFYLSDAAWETSKVKLETVGFNGDFSAPAFTQQETELACTHDEYQGKVRERWELASWGGKDPAPETVIEKLNAKWKRGGAATAGPKPVEAGAQAAAQATANAAPF